MTARAETIMAAVTTAVTGLATTGTNVTRARAWPVNSTLPALDVAQGINNVIDDDWALDSIGRELNFIITARCKATTNIETILNQISAEVYAALAANRTLGLAYVYDLNLAGDTAPEIEAEQDEPTGSMSMTWTVLYEHSETSLEA